MYNKISDMRNWFLWFQWNQLLCFVLFIDYWYVYNKMPDMIKNIPVQMQVPRYDEGFDYVCSHVHTCVYILSAST